MGTTVFKWNISRPSLNDNSHSPLQTGDSVKLRPKPKRTVKIPPRVKSVNCSLLVKGDPTELKIALHRQENTSMLMQKTEEQYWKATKSCQEYRRNFRFLSFQDVNPQELAFPLAFSLLVYRDADQVERLLRAVYRPHNLYCVHVDKKCDQTYRTKMELIARCLPNVFLSNVSVDVEWGHFTNLEPELLCMRQLWDRNKKWKYFINLTGQEFPLKTNKELVQILTAFKGANDVLGDSTIFNYRWDSFLPAPYNLTIFKGSVHIIASRPFVDYILHSNVGRELLEWVKLTAHPDESYFNTLNHNFQLGVPGSVAVNHSQNVHDSFVRYKLWVKRGLECAGQYVRGICHFGVGDLPRLTTSPQLIANKFTYDYQPLAYDCLEEWYFHKCFLEAMGTPPYLNISLYGNSKLAENRYTGPVKIW